MKVLPILLGIFCLLVSAFPCCKLDDCDSDSEVKIAENEDEPQDDDCGLCSPFIAAGAVLVLLVIQMK